MIGSGPNGLTAAITLARAGVPTTVFEAADIAGGGTRTAELTLPGFRHDICSAVHPMAIASPVFRSMPLASHGLEWIHPPFPVAHPLDDGSAAILARDLDEACERLGEDGASYRQAVEVFVRNWTELLNEIMRPVHVPTSPLLLARFGALAGWPAATSARRTFRTKAVRALFGGIAGHAVMPLDAIGSGAFGWVLAIAAHAAGWPIPRGGSQSIANALLSYFQLLGGAIVTVRRIASLDELRDFQIVLCDIAPRQFLAIASDRLPDAFADELNDYRYGPAAFKLDWALNAPIPWTSSDCARAGTVHLSGTLEESVASERAPFEGRVADRPLVLLTQPSLFDSSRAPAGKHVAWAYCHVPNGSMVDMTDRIEAQVERFAPGFRSTILARHVFTPADFELHNENLVGGDIMGGAHTVKQILIRPTGFFYRTPLPGVYFCSASTPPGGGVHGMCGFHAARIALRDIGIKVRSNPGC